MKEHSTKTETASSIVWENLEGFARAKIQEFLQDLLEEEVTELLGRRKSERRKAVDAPEGYRNGHGKERRVTMSCGTITVRRPRVRGFEERFESRILPLFVRRTKEVDELLPELYLHGLAQGDFDLALRGLLGEDAPISPGVIARLKEKWQAQWAEWNRRSLEDLEPVYVWADGIYVKAGLEKEKAALLVVLAALKDGRKVFVAIRPGFRESTESWSAVLRDLKVRGLRCPRVLVADGHLGIWGAIRNVYPEVEEQRCWNHRIVNVLDRIPKTKQLSAKKRLTTIPYAESRAEADKRKGIFQAWCREQGLEDAATLLEEDWERMVTFYQFPKEHWRHLRTTNPIESPFAALRLRTDAAKRYRKVESATGVIWRMLRVAETRFRRLIAPDLAAEVYAGAKYVDGIKVQDAEDGSERSAA
jgi:transposase-like protein